MGEKGGAMKRFLAGMVTGALTIVVLGAMVFLVASARPMLAASANALGGQEEEASVEMDGKGGGGRAEGFKRKAIRSFGANSADEAPPAPPARMLATSMASPKPAPAQEAMADKKMLAKDDDGRDKELAATVEGSGAAAAPTRAWFPETFLFEPLVATNAQGHAELAVRVPDRLTNWRVLALAHSREGSQAGAVTTFRGTLPAYVDPVIPGFLMAGDEVKLPIQVVNTTENEVIEALKVEAANARMAFVATSVRVPPGGSQVEYATLKAEQPGQVALRATLGATDAVVRTIPVQPSGRLVEVRRGGTLAAPREIELTGPAGMDPASAQVKLTVYPGALALLRSELSTASGREGTAEASYALLLAGRGEPLLKGLGGEADPQALRNLAILAGQRVIRESRSPGVEQAAMLAEAALAHPGNPVLSRLGERLAEQVGMAQRPDGTFSGGNGWTLQRLLVTTADCLRAVRAAQDTGARGRQRAAGATLRASGAFERNLDLVQDAYTASALLASGAVEGTLAEKLRERIRGAVKQNADGSRELPVEQGVVRADGTVPPAVEATALAVLALEGDPKATWRADLGASLLAAYSPTWGWGDGRTNLHALRAVLALFKDPLPARVRISLALDGKPLREGDFDAARLKDVLTLEAPAPDAAGTHQWALKAEPAIPGLGYALSLQTYVPWTKEPATGGLELATVSPEEPKVGRGVEVGLEASAPSGVPLKLRHALPAGVQADRPSLEALVSSGVIQGFRTEDGAVTLDIAPREPGQIFQARYRVVPTLAGTLRSGASVLSVADRPGLAYYVPPEVWNVK
ncbi:MAG: hypothetical protein HY901_28770 [Deltaproteobacteria bacterium]|nr:hypothetical protein [Deltaproteobacteria bacterium]